MSSPERPPQPYHVDPRSRPSNRQSTHSLLSTGYYPMPGSDPANPQPMQPPMMPPMAPPTDVHSSVGAGGYYYEPQHWDPSMQPVSSYDTMPVFHAAPVRVASYISPHYSYPQQEYHQYNQPEPLQQQYMQPEPFQPQYIQPQSQQSEPLQQQYMQPEPFQPQYINPDSLQQQYINPQSQQPELLQQQYMQPEHPQQQYMNADPLQQQYIPPQYQQPELLQQQQYIQPQYQQSNIPLPVNHPQELHQQEYQQHRDYQNHQNHSQYYPQYQPPPSNTAGTRQSTLSSAPVVMAMNKRDSSPVPPAPNPYGTYMPYDRNEPPRRRFCCCFRTRGGCMACCLFFVLILIGLAVATAILWPKQPTIYTSDPYFPSDSGGLQVSSGELSVAGIRNGLSTASVANPYTFWFPLATNVTIYSPNRIAINLDSVTFTSTLLSNTDAPLPSVQAIGSLGRVTIRQEANTTIVMPYRVMYTATSLVDLASDPALTSLVNSCRQNTPLRLSYEVILSVTLISWTGFKPSTTGKLSFACPPAVASLLSGVGK
ncbi:hypothetical protein BASA50_001212 [Batrachochytrium salamandrivorans]|uniref:Late embryogenesis abundant protein LEA-2 subgroup domain-containing protein n=1 Tax=Batrachochytrium salamandrivorans TaxID=1357716 RepID=A0ABQ8EUV2_9FUNG|nr:hypothetical protein BASA62_005380 [Batrachochytrium salamandrivorans]KAH6575206.1 hypothetical protein BASA60_005153 [Batrachochytrium salamandrivorans]KAH6585110.1 hypothetical protein BASA61_007081 [Batrachochytrium salamandrivorans]KAH6585604.1 hypothetical protein BASA50_001212 [Batrachochytrium salamandrivorans]KAH9252856.1 hypothetical protein BASA81_009159 [Batrachochytrium salamandrivorans]